MIVGLTGTNAAGKTTIARYLEKRGFMYSSLSDELRDILKFRGIEANRDNLVTVGNEMRQKYGKGYLAERILRRMNGDNVVDSIRNLGEVDALRKTNDFVLLSIDAPMETRYNRAKERGRIGDGETLQDFMEKEAREMKGEKHLQQIEACMLESDFNIINASNLQALYWQIETILKKAGDMRNAQTAQVG